ncbi:7068_t:CDS:2, partial [Acaulospora colombiana]
DPNRALNFYQTALTQAFNDERLDNSSPEVTGIMIQLGALYEELDRIRDSIDVFTMAYDVIVKPDGSSVKLDGGMKIRSISLAQKLGDLHQSLKQYEQAEKYYVWSVEQLLQAQQSELKCSLEWVIWKKHKDGLNVDLNLWKISNPKGKSLGSKARDYYEKSLRLAKQIDFKDCVNEAELALQRTAALLNEQAQ